jgi:hypothetical protein
MKDLKIMYVVRILNMSSPCWLAPWEGDPGRTLVLNNASVYKSHIEAEEAIVRARASHPFREHSYEIERCTNF